MDDMRGVPFADGRQRKPKHVFGKRKPREHTAAGPCISWRPDENGELQPYLYKRQVRPKPGRIGITKTKNGQYIIKLREP
jgi:hypothetical protein